MPEGFQQQKTTAFKNNKEENTVEIGADLIKSGFLTQFPETSLSIFLYLAATAAHEETCTIRRQKLSCLLPGDNQDLKQGLNYLQERGIITLAKKSHPAGVLLQIDFHPEKLLPASSRSKYSTLYDSPQKLAEASDDDKINSAQNENKADGQQPASNSQTVRESELTKRIKKYFPDQQGEKAQKFYNKIAQWQQDFPPSLLEKLLDRVQKWLEHPSNPRERAHYYLQAIISDWYEKEIFSLEALNEYDRIYRETKELAKKYGFKNYQQLNPVQLETLQNWLSGTRALPVEVASLAIEKAIKQKSDGRPSLEYIERNYIKPLKDAGVKNKKKAKKVMQERRQSGKKGNYQDRNIKQNYSSQQHRSNTRKNAALSWEDFLWENNR